MIDALPNDMIRLLVSKFSVVDKIKLSMTCSDLKFISNSYEFGNLHQVELKHYVGQQILYLRREWEDLWKIQKNSGGRGVVWLPLRLATFILGENVMKLHIFHNKKNTGFNPYRHRVPLLNLEEMIARSL